MLLRWILDGSLEDPHNEFFICGEPSVQGEAIWHLKYSIRKAMIPRFLSMTWTKKILSTGKSINFLNSVCKDYIHESKNEYALQEAAKSWGVDPKQEMYKLPALYVGEYAEKDAELTLKLWQACKHELQTQDVWDIFDLETALTPCLIDMRFKGVRVDIEEAERLKKMMGDEEKNLLKQIKKETSIKSSYKW